MKTLLRSIRYLSLPFSALYGTGIWLRNKGFDMGLLKSHSFDIPIIVVGNLKAGGTGKTPFTEFLIRILSEKYKVAFLSRGYMRKSKGYMLAYKDDYADRVGDEACQIKHKFPDIVVAVDENRVNGIRNILKSFPLTDVIILDDAYQHRYVKPGKCILLTEHDKPFFNDYLLPAGMLREYRRAYKRADMIVVTKCRKTFRLIDKSMFTKKINLLPDQKIFFSYIQYHTIKSVWTDKTMDFKEADTVLLVTGIANPGPLVTYLQAHTTVVSMNFPDHHPFSNDDIKKITVRFNSLKKGNNMILVTEKDAARFRGLPYVSKTIKDNAFEIPLTFNILFNERKSLEHEMIHYVKHHSSKR